MTLILSRLGDYRLGKFNDNYVTLELDAKDPDDACYLAFKGLCQVILQQDDSTKTKMLLKDIKDDFKVFKLE